MRRSVETRVLACCVVGLVALSPAATSAAPAEFDHSKLAETARTRFIIPGYSQFGRRLNALKQAIAALCMSPSQPGLDEARASYHQSIAAWGRIEIISFGPVAEQNRFERILYWPDRKGRGSRQVRRLLAKKNKDAIAPGSLASKSIAVQGLGALELVLYGTGSNDLTMTTNDGFACRYATAIAGNLARINAKILEGWQRNGAFAKLWHTPGPNNPVYLSVSETSLELVKALDNGLANLRDRRIAPVLGFGANRRRKSRPVLWRSKLSMVLIHANIAGLNDLLFEGGLADAYVESKPYQDGRAADTLSSIRSEFKLTLGMAEQLARDPDPFARPDIKSRLVPIGFPLKNIRHYAVSEIKAAAGLAIGFNASDGD